MKKFILLLAIGCVPLLCNAQQANGPAIGCIDKDIALQVEDVKHGFLEKGMKVYKDAMVGMESEVPYSIMVKLEKGHQYQLVYMGSDISATSTIEVYDGQDNLAVKKQIKRGEEPGYITFSYLPAKTDVYLIVLQQKQKHASMCGSFTILVDPTKQ